MGDNKPEQTNIKDVGEDNYNKDIFFLQMKNSIWLPKIKYGTS